MAAGVNRGSAGHVEPDRVGQMGGRRGAEPNVRSQLARRLKGHAGAARTPSVARPAALPGGGVAHDRTLQRVVVKTRVSRHAPGRARAGLTRHVRYLGRDGAGRDGGSAPFYAAAQDAVPTARSDVAMWAVDRHHFRLIVSPEREVPDLNGLVRAVMRAAERDLGTRLDWLAVNHFDTDDPHAHVLVRGRGPDGRDLVIPRRYLAGGLRNRAAELATELLGPRSAADAADRVADARRDARSPRFTWLDRVIERHLEGDRIDVSPARRLGVGPDDRRAVVARLQYLATAGLAAKEPGQRWRLEPAFGQVLRELGDRDRDAQRAQSRRDRTPSVALPLPAVAHAVPHRDAPVGGTNRPARALPLGASVSGTYVGLDRTGETVRVLVSTGEDVYAATVIDPSKMRVGAPVEVSRTAAGTTVERSDEREVGRALRRTADEREASR